ncbi:L-rhamnose mutarotase [Pseudoflavitalea sp. X16]|uniref:L-rhamnose mutarotase n=1 Tax=Paraflavitalea devenefica TaxID=2716334 RepID=UPI001420CC4F|nr:L-rhamnose mutarotase [Paraflavitalea devenefica]NII26024.1 L-rhamnose mutarotase [Paraflavitalea devenefica]
MKHLSILLVLLLIALLPFKGITQIWVAVDGSDRNPGTATQPKASLQAALRQARELRRLQDPAIGNGIRIILKGGVYRLQEPVFIRPEDAGSAASPLFIEGAPGEQPILSGGITVSGWKKATGNLPGLPAAAKGKVWVADAPQNGDAIIDFRQLYVNDKKAIRARDRDTDSMNRILSWDPINEQCWIPTPKTPALLTAAGTEMVIHQWWAIAVLRISKMEVRGDSTRLSFYQPESRVQSEHPWPAPWISKQSGNSAFYLANAIQFLNTPGEWFLDKQQRKLYYWPLSGEDMTTAQVTVPYLETLLRVEGTAGNTVSHVHIKGLSFQHSTWLRPSQQGHVPLQAGMYLLDAYKLKIPGTPDKKGLENQAWIGRQPAAVRLAFVNNTSFNGCRFARLGAIGIDYVKGTDRDSITGCLFTDISGTAIQAGTFSEEPFETHLPYKPSDERELCRNLTIGNNLISSTANEDWGCPGISAGYVRDINIHHNELCELPYSGICVGWGWTKTPNAMRNNRIHANYIHHYAKHMYDVAGIYTLSAQPGSQITNNRIDSIYKAPYAHIPSHWFYLYTDEGTAYYTVKDNWCPAEKFLQNANGPGNEWVNNGPLVQDSIKESAGLQAAYKHLLNEIPATFSWQSINRDSSQQIIIEMVTDSAHQITPGKLKELLSLTHMSMTVYKWKNHWIIFTENTMPPRLWQLSLQHLFAGVRVKTYDNPFYVFNRTKCADAVTAPEWDHIILTANLVADEQLQQEYIQYHATQYQQWPEVSKGFCNAQFQQLLLFRNGRQLMLVISIPKGASLDTLNPKTTENNPRVDEWNALMKKYQEGIEGTAKGETWVILERQW